MYIRIYMDGYLRRDGGSEVEMANVFVVHESVRVGVRPSVFGARTGPSTNLTDTEREREREREREPASWPQHQVAESEGILDGQGRLPSNSPILYQTFSCTWKATLPKTTGPPKPPSGPLHIE